MQSHDVTNSSLEGTNEQKLAAALELWEKEVADGKVPDTLRIANGDASFEKEILDLVSVIKKVDQSGFGEIDNSKLANLVGDESKSLHLSIPDFEWMSELGRGGMGVVFEARQLSLNRMVAIKLLPSGSFDPQAERRFEREAETASSLQHPHIVPIYAAGQTSGTHWYAMQKIDGQSLAEIIDDHPKGIDWHRSVEIGIQVAEALVYAHQKGVVHRDVKPGNLLEDRSGHIWLTDFGLARSDADATTTLSHAMLGTPRYMCPEQIDAVQDIDHRADLYGLGATLYELVSGSPLYSGTTPLEIINKIRVDEPKPLSEFNPRIPRALEIVILKCLEKSPRDRYATAADLLSDLKAVQAGLPIQAHGLSIWTKWRRKIVRHKSRIRIACTAALIPLMIAGASSVLYQSYRTSQMSALKIRSAGGPYMARIQKSIGNDHRSTSSPMHAALPVDQGIPLEIGQYEVSFSSRGNFSEKARLRLSAGTGFDAQYVDRRPSPYEINVEEKWHEIIQTYDEPSRREGFKNAFLALLNTEKFIVFEQAREKFSLSLSDIGKELNRDDQSQSIDFRPELATSVQGNRHSRNPYFAKVNRMLQDALDLDGDGQVDFIVSARTEPVIAAIGGDGNKLWSARCEVALPEQSATPYQNPNKSLVPYPAVRQLLVTDDHSGDGLRDILVNTLAIRSTACYAQLTLLSGRDGTPLWTLPLPAMTPTDGTRWPLDGLLNNYEWMKRRQPQLLMEASYGFPVTNITVSPQFDVQWGNMLQARVPVTPPILLFERDGKQVAAVAIDNFSIRCLEVRTGEWNENIWSDTNSLLLAPFRVRLGAGQPEGWLSMRLAAPTNQGSGGLEQLSVTDPNGSKPLWSKTFAQRLEYIAGKQERSDFPLIVDLDHDGVDEIIVAHSKHHLAAAKTIECLNAKSGKSLWRRKDSIPCMEVIPERICVVDDLDSDGVDDFAIATLFNETRRQSPSKALPDVSVFVDCMSGKTGKQLRLFSEAIVDAGRIDDLISIDSIRSVGNRIEIGIVWGKSDVRLLDSRTVRFSLGDHSIPPIAEGLTPLPSTRNDAGYYLMRPGPLDSQPTTVQWIDSSRDETLYCDQQTIHAAWSNSLGQPRLLLGRFRRDSMNGPWVESPTLSAVDSQSGKILWEKHIDGQDIFIKAVELSGSKSLFVQYTKFKPYAKQYCDFLLLDPETGVVRTRGVSDPLRSIVQSVQSTDSPFLFVIGTYFFGIRQSSSSETCVAKIDMSRCQIVWHSPLRMGTSLGADLFRCNLLTADVDSDGFEDCIVPFHEANNGSNSPQNSKQGIKALSGKDGKELWSRRMKILTALSPKCRWPQMTWSDPKSRDSHILLLGMEDDGTHAIRKIHSRDGTVIESTSLNTPDSMLLSPATSNGVSRRLEWSGSRLTCLEGQNANIVWQCDLEANKNLQERTTEIGKIQFIEELVEQHALRVETKLTDWFLDDRTGNLLCTVTKNRSMETDPLQGYRRGTNRSNPTNGPILHRGHGLNVAFTTPDGVQVDSIPNRESEKPKYSMDESFVDPRAFEAPPMSLLHHNITLTTLIVHVANSTLWQFFAILLPAYCIYRVGRDRRFSLAHFMLAPPIVVLSILSWQQLFTSDAPIPNGNAQTVYTLFQVAFSLLGMAFCFSCLLRRHFLPLGAAFSLALSMTLCIQIYCWLVNAYEGTNRFQTGWDHFVAIAIHLSGTTLWISGLNYFAMVRLFSKRPTEKQR